MHKYTHGGENKIGWCARVIKPVAILRTDLFSAESENISAHMLVHEAQFVYGPAGLSGAHIVSRSFSREKIIRSVKLKPKICK